MYKRQLQDRIFNQEKAGKIEILWDSQLSEVIGDEMTFIIWFCVSVHPPDNTVYSITWFPAPRESGLK